MENEIKQIDTKEISFYIDSQALIAQAIEKNTPIETMEKLLAMRRELKAEMARDAFFKNLALFQAECPVIEKKKPVYDKQGKLRYKYAPLADIVKQVSPFLLKYGFSYTIKTKQDGNSVTSVCVAHHELGHQEETEFKVPVDASAYMNVAQKFASALTYSERYAFCGTFGIMTATEDDDANFTGEQIKSLSYPEKKEEKEEISFKQRKFNSLPEENKAIYQSIMALIREKVNGRNIYNPKEQENNKKKADNLASNLNELTVFYQVFKQISEKRRSALKGEKHGQDI